MKQWLKADLPLDVGAFYDAKYQKDGFYALHKTDWGSEIKFLEELVDIRPFMHLLDAGCGHGDFLSKVAHRLKCFGLDVSKEAVSLARKRFKDNVPIAHGSIEEVGKNQNWQLFDIITSFGALEHTMNPRECFDRLYRFLVPRGVLFITVPLESEDSLKHIQAELNQKTNERFASELEWIDYFDLAPQKISIIGDHVALGYKKG